MSSSLPVFFKHLQHIAIWKLILGVLVFVLAILIFQTIFYKVHNWLTANKDFLQAAASIATIMALFVATIAIVAAGSQAFLTYRGQRLTAAQQRNAAQTQAETAVASLMQAHLNFSTQHPELNTTQKPYVVRNRFRRPGYANTHPRQARLTPEYAFFAAHAIFTAENIFLIAQRQGWEAPSWENTVKDMIGRHNTYVCNEVFDKKQYAVEFYNLIQSLEQHDKLCERKNILRLH